MARIIVVGDVHGCLTELRELVAKLQLKEDDRLIFLGDFMDKGPLSADTVGYVRELGAESVLGNHEEKHLRWRRHQDKKEADPSYVIPIRPIGKLKQLSNALLNDGDIAWLSQLPLVITIGNWVIVHGGLLPNKTLNEMLSNKRSRGEILRLRFIDAEGKHVPVDYDADGGNPKPIRESVLWSKVYTGTQHVVYGHEAHSLTTPRYDENDQGAIMLGIDTGVCHGGHLTALVLDAHSVDAVNPSYSFIQVKAHDTYQRLPTPSS